MKGQYNGKAGKCFDLGSTGLAAAISSVEKGPIFTNNLQEASFIPSFSCFQT
jgi:hypothetical protein